MMGKNLFQKIVDSLFDEVVIEEVEETGEEEVSLPPVSNVVLPKSASTVSLKEKPKEEPIQKEVLKKEARSTMISVDELKEPPVTVKKITPERKAKPEYEFTKVISPIFGVVKEANEKSEEFLPSTPAKKKVAKSGSILGTVISPIYGINKEEEAVDMNFSLDEEEAQLTLDDLIETYASNNTEEIVKDEVDPIHYEENFDSLVKSLQEEDPIQEESSKRVIESQNLSLFDDFEEENQ